MNSTEDPDNRNYYEILGVPKDADLNTLKKAYKKKAMYAYYSIKHNETEEGEACNFIFFCFVTLSQFKKISRAYEVLSDPEKRACYDQYGTDELEKIEEINKANMEGKKALLL